MFSATNKGEVKQQKHAYVSEICGPSWWAMLHGAASGIKAGCPTCGDEADSLMRYAHDLVNVKHGKKVFAPADAREWSEVAVQLAQSLKVGMSNSDIPTGQNMTLAQRKRGARCPLDARTAKEIPGEIARFMREAKLAIAAGEFAKFARSIETMCNTQQQRFAQDVIPVKISGKCDSEGCDISATAGGKTLEKQPKIKVPITDLSRSGVQAAVAEARDQLREASPTPTRTKLAPTPVKPDLNTFADLDGKRIELTLDGLDHRRLIASNDEQTGEVNEDYPGWLQPRDRSRAANINQVRTMAANLNPSQLTIDYHTLGKGAPVVAKTATGFGSHYVVSGNGRAMALKLAIDNFERNIDREPYLAYLAEARKEFPTISEGEILVRVITGDKTDEELKEIAELGNVSAAIATSSIEQAAIDSAKMNAEFVGRLQPLDDESASIQKTISAMKNRGWVTDFLALVPPTELAGLVDSDGLINSAGIQRAVLALAIWLFGPDYGSKMASRAYESTADNPAGNVVQGVFRSVPRMAEMVAQLEKYAASAGEETRGVAVAQLEQLNIAPAIAKAVMQYIAIKDRNISIADALAQTAMFAEVEITGIERTLIVLFDANKRSAKAITEVINQYVGAVIALPDPSQIGFAGLAPEEGLIDPDTLLKAIQRGEGWKPQTGMFQQQTRGNKLTNYVVQNKRLTAADRRRLKPSQFACPDERAYPINDKGHIISALGRYRQADTLKCKGGAKRICTAAKKAKIHTEVCPL